MGDKKRVSAATTFRRDEIVLLDKLFTLLLRGGRPSECSVLVRRLEFASVFKKVQHMKETVGIE